MMGKRPRTLLIGFLMGTAAMAQAKGFVTAKDGKLYHEGREWFSYGLNYYAKSKIWEDFWTEYQPAEVENDLRVISAMGFNTVRIFINYWTFSDSKFKLEAHGKLRNFLELAAKHNLLVMVALFDWVSLYDKDFEQFTRPFLDEIVRPFVHSPQIAAWDLKNEPDNDSQFYPENLVMSWLGKTFEYVRRLDQNHLITIGTRDILTKTAVLEKLDFISFHFYQSISKLHQVIDNLAMWFPRRPIVLQEVGYHTLPPENDEKRQRGYLLQALTTSLRRGLSGILLWTLHDHNPNRGRTRPPFENRFGLYDLAGKAKEVVSSLSHPAYLYQEGSSESLLAGLAFWRKNLGICLRLAADDLVTIALVQDSTEKIIAKSQLSAGFHCVNENVSHLKLKKDSKLKISASSFVHFATGKNVGTTVILPID